MQTKQRALPGAESGRSNAAIRTHSLAMRFLAQCSAVLILVVSVRRTQRKDAHRYERGLCAGPYPDPATRTWRNRAAKETTTTMFTSLQGVGSDRKQRQASVRTPGRNTRQPPLRQWEQTNWGSLVAHPKGTHERAKKTGQPRQAAKDSRQRHPGLPGMEKRPNTKTPAGRKQKLEARKQRPSREGRQGVHKET